jgi:hypothetical protein
VLEGYIAAGFDPGGFWTLCPAEFRAHMAGAARRRAGEEDLMRWQVWHGAALARAERIPSFDQFARNAPPSQAELQSKALQWAARIAQDQRG